MTPITKQQVEELIDRLASKELTFGCLVEDYASGKTMRYAGKHFEDAKMIDSHAYYSLWDGEQELFRERNDDFTYPKNRILGHPILLGDVLNAMNDKGFKFSEECVSLLKRWAVCTSWEESEAGETGFTKSLQEVAGRIEWEEEQFHNHGDEACDEGCAPFEVAKPSPEADLLLFIHNLGL